MRILGLDVSSTTIGWCILDIDAKDSIKFIKCNFFKPIKKGTIFERLEFVQETIKQIICEYEPNEVIIEDITKFMPHVSSAQTIITLAIFNRTVGLTALNVLKKSPELFSVMAMRHGLKLTKELPKKEEIPELVEKHLKIKFPYVYAKNGKLKNEVYDMADACVVALYYAFKITNKLEALKRNRDLLL